MAPHTNFFGEARYFFEEFNENKTLHFNVLKTAVQQYYLKKKNKTYHNTLCTMEFYSKHI